LTILYFIILIIQPANSAKINEDFILNITVDNLDITEKKEVSFPTNETVSIIYNFKALRDVKINSLSLTLTFAEQNIISRELPLKAKYLPKGSKLTGIVNASVKLLGMPIATGNYKVELKLDYEVNGERKVWKEPITVKILGNPLTTAAGGLAVLTTFLTVAEVFSSFRAVNPKVKANEVLPQSSEIRIDKPKEYLEPLVRGRFVAALTSEVKKRIRKRFCPICASKLKKNYCSKCNLSEEDAKKQYLSRMNEILPKVLNLLLDTRSLTLTSICKRFNINQKMASDVLASFRNSGIAKLKGLSLGLVKKGITIGINFSISTILWITIGGFAILNQTQLITIIVLSILIPAIIGKLSERRAKK
jgi:predicted transcriptional regulator